MVAERAIGSNGRSEIEGSEGGDLPQKFSRPRTNDSRDIQNKFNKCNEMIKDAVATAPSEPRQLGQERAQFENTSPKTLPIPTRPETGSGQKTSARTFPSKIGTIAEIVSGRSEDKKCSKSNFKNSESLRTRCFAWHRSGGRNSTTSFGTKSSDMYTAEQNYERHQNQVFGQVRVPARHQEQSLRDQSIQREAWHSDHHQQRYREQELQAIGEVPFQRYPDMNGYGNTFMSASKFRSSIRFPRSTSKQTFGREQNFRQHQYQGVREQDFRQQEQQREVRERDFRQQSRTQSRTWIPTPMNVHRVSRVADTSSDMTFRITARGRSSTRIRIPRRTSM